MPRIFSGEGVDDAMEFMGQLEAERDNNVVSLEADALLYTLVNNESGDWYVIPVDRVDEWEQWLYPEDGEIGDVPDWAEYVQDPSGVVFSKWSKR